MNIWIDALKRNMKNAKWAIPKKGTSEHNEVMEIMKGGGGVGGKDVEFTTKSGQQVAFNVKK